MPGSDYGHYGALSAIPAKTPLSAIVLQEHREQTPCLNLSAGPVAALGEGQKPESASGEEA